MSKKKKMSLVTYDHILPGFEAVFTGKKASSESGESDGAGNEISRWSVFTWTFSGQEKDWGEEIKHVNTMQSKLGDLDYSTRQIRAHIGSLVPCDSGFPVTVDELLNAIGRGKLDEPSFHNGCWNCGMWWEQKTSQPLQMQTMKIIYDVLKSYLAARGKEKLVKKYPHTTGFINRTYQWLGPVDKLTDVQKLMMKRILLTIDLLSKFSFTEPSSQISDASKLQKMMDMGNDLFSDESGRGASLDAEISKKAGLPKINPWWWSEEFKKNLETIEDPQKKELYTICAHISFGVYGSSDCHHNTFRVIESWIYEIGTGKIGIPTRKVGAEKERLGHLLFGYVLGLDKWLAGMPMQLLLLDLGHVDLGFDPKNEILRVYAYLGEERTPMKKWLAACLWHNLMYNPIDPSCPAGLVSHKNLLDDAQKAGICLREWMDSVLKADLLR